jgi:PTH1 family peptidyl-tRNA hydrolase
METRLIVGLGNPGQEYDQTRHNVGWLFLDYCQKKLDCKQFKDESMLSSQITKCKIPSGKRNIPAILAKSLVYVNTTGAVVSKLSRNYKIKPKNIVVVHDDLDIDFGNAKLSFDKNSGGHKGINSIIKALKTKKFYRLRIGTQTNSLKKARRQTDKRRDVFVRNFVLSKFTKNEKEALNKIFKNALSKIII